MSNKLNYSVSEVNDLLRKLENDVALQTDLNELKKEIEGGVLKPEDAEKTYATKESVSDINKVLYGDDTQNGIPVSNNDFVENIYVNKNLSPDQVDAILNAVSTEAWIEMGETEKLLFIISNQNATKVLGVICFVLDGVPQGFVIMSLAEQLIYYVSPSISDMLGDDFGGVSGWNPEAPSIIEWNDEAVKNTAVEGLNITVGEYNHELVEIFSLNNVFSTPEGIVLETEKLSRTVYGKTFESTPVIINAPNPINLYFNTTMDSDTVEQLCNQLLERTGQHRYFITVGKMAEMAGGNIAIFYQDNEQPSTDPTWSGDTHGQMIGFAGFKDDNNTVVAEADIFSIWKPGDGWDPVHIFNNLAAPFSFIETTVDVPGYEVGKYNELIKDVVSSSAFRENIIGLEEQVQELNEDVDKIEESLGDISSLLDEINGSGTLPPDILIANCEVGDIDSGTSYYFSSDIDIREIYKYSNIDLVATVNDGTNVSSITLPMQSFAKVNVSGGLTQYQLIYNLTVLDESFTECVLGTVLNSDGEVWFSAVSMGVPKESMPTTKFQLKAYNVGKISSSGSSSDGASVSVSNVVRLDSVGVDLFTAYNGQSIDRNLTAEEVEVFNQFVNNENLTSLYAKIEGLADVVLTKSAYITQDSAKIISFSAVIMDCYLDTIVCVYPEGSGVLGSIEISKRDLTMPKIAEECPYFGDEIYTLLTGNRVNDRKLTTAELDYFTNIKDKNSDLKITVKNTAIQVHFHKYYTGPDRLIYRTIDGNKIYSIIIYFDDDRGEEYSYTVGFDSDILTEENEFNSLKTRVETLENQGGSSGSGITKVEINCTVSGKDTEDPTAFLFTSDKDLLELENCDTIIMIDTGGIVPTKWNSLMITGSTQTEMFMALFDNLDFKIIVMKMQNRNAITNQTEELSISAFKLIGYKF